MVGGVVLFCVYYGFFFSLLGLVLLFFRGVFFDFLVIVFYSVVVFVSV